MTNPNLQYLPPLGQKPQPERERSPSPPHLAIPDKAVDAAVLVRITRWLMSPPQPNKYRDADDYDARRENTPKYLAEQAVVETLLSDLPSGTWVLDAPCGTGRFFDFYAKKSFIVRCLDLEAKMIRRAAKKVPAGGGTAMIGEVAQWRFIEGDLLLGGGHGPDAIRRALLEMQRIARARIVFTARVRNHRFAVSHDLIESALQGWRIHRDEAGYSEDYRVIELRPS